MVHFGALIVISPSLQTSEIRARTLDVFLGPRPSELVPNVSATEQIPDPELHESAAPQGPNTFSTEHAIQQRVLNNEPVISTGIHYFLSSDVDVPAEPISRPSIIYPEHALLSKLSGTVRARLFIDVEGRVNSIEIVELQPAYPPFEEIAINALIETRFSPAKRFGKTVNSQKVVEVFFNPYEDSTGQR